MTNKRFHVVSFKTQYENREAECVPKLVLLDEIENLLKINIVSILLEDVLATVLRLPIHLCRMGL